MRPGRVLPVGSPGHRGGGRKDTLPPGLWASERVAKARGQAARPVQGQLEQTSKAAGAGPGALSAGAATRPSGGLRQGAQAGAGCSRVAYGER